jgi:hypothetical protein
MSRLDGRLLHPHPESHPPSSANTAASAHGGWRIMDVFGIGPTRARKHSCQSAPHFCLLRPGASFVSFRGRPLLKEQQEILSLDLSLKVIESRLLRKSGGLSTRIFTIRLSTARIGKAPAVVTGLELKRLEAMMSSTACLMKCLLNLRLAHSFSSSQGLLREERESHQCRTLGLPG